MSYKFSLSTLILLTTLALSACQDPAEPALPIDSQAPVSQPQQPNKPNDNSDNAVKPNTPAADNDADKAETSGGADSNFDQADNAATTPTTGDPETPAAGNDNDQADTPAGTDDATEPDTDTDTDNDADNLPAYTGHKFVINISADEVSVPKYENGLHHKNKIGYLCDGYPQLPAGKTCGVLAYTITTSDFAEILQQPSEQAVKLHYKLVANKGNIGDIIDSYHVYGSDKIYKPQGNDVSGDISLSKDNIQSKVVFLLKTDGKNTGDWIVNLEVSEQPKRGMVKSINLNWGKDTPIIDPQASDGTPPAPAAANINLSSLNASNTVFAEDGSNDGANPASCIAGQNCNLLQYELSANAAELVGYSEHDPVLVDYKLHSSKHNISNIVAQKTSGTVKLYEGKNSAVVSFKLKTDAKKTGNWHAQFSIANQRNANVGINNKINSTIIDPQSNSNSGQTDGSQQPSAPEQDPAAPAAPQDAKVKIKLSAVAPSDTVYAENGASANLACIANKPCNLLAYNISATVSELRKLSQGQQVSVNYQLAASNHDISDILQIGNRAVGSVFLSKDKPSQTVYFALRSDNKKTGDWLSSFSISNGLNADTSASKAISAVIYDPQNQTIPPALNATVRLISQASEFAEDGSYDEASTSCKPAVSCNLLAFEISAAAGTLANYSRSNPALVGYELSAANQDISKILANLSATVGAVQLYKDKPTSMVYFVLKTDQQKTGDWQAQFKLINNTSQALTVTIKDPQSKATSTDTDESIDTAKDVAINIANHAAADTIYASNGEHDSKTNSCIAGKNCNLVSFTISADAAALAAYGPEKQAVEVAYEFSTANGGAAGGTAAQIDRILARGSAATGSVNLYKGHSSETVSIVLNNAVTTGAWQINFAVSNKAHADVTKADALSISLLDTTPTTPEPPAGDTTAAKLALNDTGVNFSANVLQGNDTLCQADSQQDCSVGNDATKNDDSDGHAGFQFVKLDNAGNELAKDAADWVCVKDKVTGLIWERKTYSDAAKDERDSTLEYSFAEAGDYINKMNTTLKPCGIDNWRLPTRMELYDIFNFGSAEREYSFHATNWLFSVYQNAKDENDINEDKDTNIVDKRFMKLKLLYWTSTKAPEKVTTKNASKVSFSYVWAIYGDGKAEPQDSSSQWTSNGVLAVAKPKS